MPITATTTLTVITVRTLESSAVDQVRCVTCMCQSCDSHMTCIMYSVGCELRLVDGYQWSGRLEVRVNGEWRGVCDDEWDTLDAQVACRQLGYSDSIAYTRGLEGTKSYWIDNAECAGTEEKLCDCPGNDLGVENCGITEGAGVACAGQCTTCHTYFTYCDYAGISPFEVRLGGGSVPWEGRAEVRLNDVWGQLCKDGWSTTNSVVVCKELGYPGGTLCKDQQILVVSSLSNSCS